MCGILHIQSIKPFSNDTKVNAIWPLNVTFILKIAQFMSKTICGKTYDIGYIYLWSIRERDFIFGMHIEIMKNL